MSSTKPKTKAGPQWKPGRKPTVYWWGKPYVLKHPGLLEHVLASQSTSPYSAYSPLLSPDEKNAAMERAAKRAEEAEKAAERAANRAEEAGRAAEAERVAKKTAEEAFKALIAHPEGQGSSSTLGELTMAAEAATEAVKEAKAKVKKLRLEWAENAAEVAEETLAVILKDAKYDSELVTLFKSRQEKLNKLEETRADDEDITEMWYEKYQLPKESKDRVDTDKVQKALNEKGSELNAHTLMDSMEQEYVDAMEAYEIASEKYDKINSQTKKATKKKLVKLKKETLNQRNTTRAKFQSYLTSVNEEKPRSENHMEAFEDMMAKLGGFQKEVISLEQLWTIIEDANKAIEIYDTKVDEALAKEEDTADLKAMILDIAMTIAQLTVKYFVRVKPTLRATEVNSAYDDSIKTIKMHQVRITRLAKDKELNILNVDIEEADKAFIEAKAAAVDAAEKVERAHGLIRAGDDSPEMRTRVRQYETEAAELIDARDEAHKAYEEALQKQIEWVKEQQDET